MQKTYNLSSSMSMSINDTDRNEISLKVQWSKQRVSIFTINLKDKYSSVVCLSYQRDPHKEVTANISQSIQSSILADLKKGIPKLSIIKNILSKFTLSGDMKQIIPINDRLCGGGGCGSKSYREVNEATVIKKEINQAKQKRKRNDQSIIKADIQQLNEKIEGIINTKDEDIYNGKTYILDTIFPIIDKQGIVSNRVLHQNLSRVLQKAMNLLLRVKSSGGQSNGGNAEKKDEEEKKGDEDQVDFELEEGVDEDLIWTEKDKASMHEVLTNIIDRINGRIGSEPLLNQVYCVTMVKNILATHNHSLKLIDEAIRYGVPLFGLIRNQDPTLLLMLAVKGLKLLDQQLTKNKIQKMMNFQIKVIDCISKLPKEFKGESDNVRLLFAQFNALDDFMNKKNNEDWEVQYFCLMQINELIKIMIDQQEIIQIGKSAHWNSFFNDEFKGMFTICSRKFSMSGIFLANAIESLLVNHKFLRSISLDIIINSLKLIKISEEKIKQNNPNETMKSEIIRILYQRWLFENNNQVRTQFIDVDVLASIDTLMQNKQRKGDDGKIVRQGRQHHQSAPILTTTAEDDYDKKLVDFANEEQKALKEIQKQIKQSPKSFSEIEDELVSMNNTLDCIQSDDGIKKVINIRQQELWKQSILNRRAQGIVQKDDLLLETINLYVNQRLQEKHLVDLEDQQENQQKPQEFDALGYIKNQFIKKKNDQSQQPPLLTIVANGGMGKSMLLKKIEMELLDDYSKSGNENIYERVPIIVKMADLDPENPNLIEYLDSQPIFKELRLDASVLQSSSMNKLILFDAFDEFKGKPFNLWSAFNLGQWQNTKFIVTSREENLLKEDYNQYFSVHTSQSQQEQADNKKQKQSFLLFSLIKFGKEQLTEFASKLLDSEKNQNKEDLLKEFTSIINENQKVLSLISLPINAFIFIKTFPQLKNQNKSISVRNQTELLELFFNYQFERESLMLPKAGSDQTLCLLYKQQFFYFFQQIAIHMFKQGTLSADIYDIKIDLIPSFKKKLSGKEQTELLKTLSDYRNPQVISLADDSGMNLDDIKFVHKSLFEYFVARAMKFDFDQLEENNKKAVDLSFEEISNFSINSKYIMEKGSSEISILQQLARMIKPVIVSVQFQEKCEQEESIQNQHNYIQIILLTRRQHHGEKLDIASSNMLSAIAYNKPALSGLKLTRCSFKKAYLYNYRGNIDITGSNLREAMLGQTEVDYSRSKTQLAQTQDVQSFWSSIDLYSFCACIVTKQQKNPNKLSIIQGSLGGYLNEFELELNGTYTKDANDFYVIPNQKLYELKRSKRLYQGLIRDILQYENKYIVVQQNNIIVVDDKGEEQFLFQAHKFPIFSIDINFSLKHLATCDTNKNIKIWNIAKQFSLISSFEETHKQTIVSIKYSQSQNILVSASKDTSCKVWKMEGNEYVMKYQIEIVDPIDQMNFTPDGNHLFIILGFMKGIRIVPLNENEAQEMKRVEQRWPFTTKIIYSPDCKYLVALNSNSASVMDVSKDYEKIKSLKFNFYSSYVQNACFSSDSRYLVCCGSDNSCAVWDFQQDFKLVSNIAGHQDTIKKLGYTPDSKYFISASQYYFYIWEVKISDADGSHNYELISVTQTPNLYEVRQLTFLNSNGKNSYKFAIATIKDYLILYEFDSLKSTVTLLKQIENKDKQQPIALEYSQDDKYILSATNMNQLHIYDIQNDYSLLRTFEGGDHDQDITSACFYSDLSKDYHLVIIGYSKLTIELWDITEKSAIEKYKTIPLQAASTRLISSLSGNFLASSGDDNSIQIWDAKKDFAFLKIITEIKEKILNMCFSHNSSSLAVSSLDKCIRIFKAECNFESPQLINYEETITNICISFHPSNSQILLCSYDSILYVWDLQKAYEVDKNLQGHTAIIVATGFSHDGTYYVTACGDSIMKLWYCSNDLKDDKLVPTYELISTVQLNSPKKYEVTHIDFMLDNKHFITTCKDGTTRIWSIDQMTITPCHTIPAQNEKSSTRQLSLYPENESYLALAALGDGILIYTMPNPGQSFQNIQLYKQIKNAKIQIRSVKFSPNKKYLAAGSDSQVTYFYDSQENGNAKPSFDLLFQFKYDDYAYVDTLTFTPNSKYLLIGYFIKTCCVYDLEKRFVIQKIERFNQYISGVEVTGDGEYAVISQYSKDFMVYKLNKNIEDEQKEQEVFQFIEKNSEHSDKIQNLRICPATNLISVGQKDRICKIWKLQYDSTSQDNKLKLWNIQNI